MSLIRVTEDGIEVDGILLKDNVDIKTYIDVHQPNAVSVSLSTHQPAELSFIFGVSEPAQLPIYIGFVFPEQLDILFHIWQRHDLEVLINSHTFGELTAYVVSHPPKDYLVDFNLHWPTSVDVYMLSIPYHKFLVELQIFHTTDMLTYIASHLDNRINVLLRLTEPVMLYTFINPVYKHSFNAWFFIVKFGNAALNLYLRVLKKENYDLVTSLHGWDTHHFVIPIKLSNPYGYTVPMWIWTPLDVQTFINVVLPNPMDVAFTIQPEDGIDLRIIHGFMKMQSLSIVLATWRNFYSLPTYLWGVYTSDHLVDFSMGGSLRLEVLLPGTSGYELLYITLRPSSRIMTTIIPIYTMELLDLYVSINQGWPCGFGSSYKLLTVEFDYAYLKALTVDFKVIYGSGIPILKTYINKTYFDTYRQSKSFTVYVPEDAELEDVFVADGVPTATSTDFTRIKIGSIKVRFSWPRLKIGVGGVILSVSINPVPIITLPLDLIVSLWANRPDPPTQPSSRPIIMRESALDEPVWPQIFQVHEIELWGDDPPHVVRKIEILFDTQVTEYYWVSSEQRAYAKEMWEQWAFLTRGYLPDAQYSGQIQYSTMHTLSTMVRYDTVDQAIRAMIANFAYKDKSSLSVFLKGTGALTRLSVYIDVRDFGRMRKLPVIIEPMHPYNLEINININ